MNHSTYRVPARWAPTAADTMIAEAVAYLVSAQSVLDSLTRSPLSREIRQMDLELAARGLAVALVSLDTTLRTPEPPSVQAHFELPTQMTSTPVAILDPATPSVSGAEAFL